MSEEKEPATTEQAKAIGNDNNKTNSEKNQVELDSYKSKIDLNEVVQAFGYKYLKEKSSITSKQYKSESDDSKIVVTFKDNKYIYFSMTDEKDKGTIVDFLQNRGIGNLGNVVKWCKYYANNHYTIPIQQIQESRGTIDKDKLEKIWFAIKNIDSIPTIRGIRTDILQQAIDNNSIKIDKNLNIYFALIDLNSLCGIEIRNGSEKRLIKGSKKGVWRFGAKVIDAKTIVVCESGIDILSYIQLHNDDTNSTMYIATIGQYGNTTKEIITAIAKANKQVKWIIATDNDQAGEKMAEQIKTDIQEINSMATIERKKSQNKDWNDDLNMQYGEKKEAKMNEKRKPAVEEQAKANGSSNNKAETTESQTQLEIKKNPETKFNVLYTRDLLAGEPPKPTDFVIGGLPAMQLGLLIGSDGTGKSMLALQMAVSVTCGINVAGGAMPAPEKTGKVVYVSGEDDADYIHKRLIVLKNNITQYQPDIDIDFEVVALDGDRLPLVSVIKGQIEDNENNINELKKLITDRRLLIIDPLVMFHDLNENDNGHMDYLARLLIRISKQTGCTIIAVHHAGQEAIINGRDDHQAGRGATALAAAARAVWVLRRLDKGEKQNYRNHNPLKLRILRGSKVSRMAETDGVLLRIEDDGMLNKTEIPLSNHKGDHYRDED